MASETLSRLFRQEPIFPDLPNERYIDRFFSTIFWKEAELRELRERKVDAVVVFPRRATAGGPLRVRSYVDRSAISTSQGISGTLNQIAQDLNQRAADGARFPQVVALGTEGIHSRNLDFIAFLVPGILAMSVRQAGIMGIAGSFGVLRERGVLRRIRATPFPLVSFIGVRIASQLVFGVTFVGGPLSLAGRRRPGSLAFLAVASVSRKQESAVALANLISFPMHFLSGIIFPLDQSPVWLQDLARVLPHSYLADGLRQIRVYGVSPGHLWLDAAALTLTIALNLAVRFIPWEPKTS